MNKAIYLTTMALGLAACGHETTETATPEHSSANAITIQAESLATVVAVDGNIEARNRASLSTRMMARVTAIPVEVGDHVRAGQTLIRLGTEDISANRAKAEAAVTLAQAARDEAARKAEAERDEARAEVERLRGMLRKVGERDEASMCRHAWDTCHLCGAESGEYGEPPNLMHSDDCPTREPWFAQEVSGG